MREQKIEEKMAEDIWRDKIKHIYKYPMNLGTRRSQKERARNWAIDQGYISGGQKTFIFNKDITKPNMCEILREGVIMSTRSKRINMIFENSSKTLSVEKVIGDKYLSRYMSEFLTVKKPSYL